MSIKTLKRKEITSAAAVWSCSWYSLRFQLFRQALSCLFKTHPQPRLVGHPDTPVDLDMPKVSGQSAFSNNFLSPLEVFAELFQWIKQHHFFSLGFLLSRPLFWKLWHCIMCLWVMCLRQMLSVKQKLKAKMGLTWGLCWAGRVKNEGAHFTKSARRQSRFSILQSWTAIRHYN